MMSGYHNELHEGSRVFLKGEGAATIVSKEYEYNRSRDTFSSYSDTRFKYQIKFDKDERLVEFGADFSDSHRLYNNLIFCPNSGFKVGDTMEIAREGLEPNLRGTLLEIDESAEMWPYRVGQQDGVSVWFGYKELTKIHSIISAQRSSGAKEVLRKKIAEARSELEALETALEVLEYAS